MRNNQIRCHRGWPTGCVTDPGETGHRITATLAADIYEQLNILFGKTGVRVTPGASTIMNVRVAAPVASAAATAVQSASSSGMPKPVPAPIDITGLRRAPRRQRDRHDHQHRKPRERDRQRSR